ncbi:MAG: AMP phosphorylase [Thermoproteota archaeon]|nr:AMP phosphorylase [Candidatus Brockarchaeota archaeon]
MDKLKVKLIDIKQGGFEVLLNSQDAEELGIHPLDRVKISCEKGSLTAVANITPTLVKRGEIGIFTEVSDALGLTEGELVNAIPGERPLSLQYIKKKMNGQKLSKQEIYTIVSDIVDNTLSDIELSAYVTAVTIRGMDMDEIAEMVNAMVDTGERIVFDKSPIVDVHSIGGIPGNKYALLTVPIVAANGVTIPKTSSRAITSPSGIADTMEVLAPVSHTAQKIKQIAETVGGTLVWGGSVNLAPADDKIIRVEYPLSLDPKPQVLASVISKKKAAGVEILLIDLPMGRGAKVETEDEARELAQDFIELGRRVGIRVECAITYGSQPLGRAVGPALEAREALMALEGKYAPRSLVEKSCALAGILLEMAGVAERGRGKYIAEETLRSGKALSKFKEIVEAQDGNPDVTSDDIEVGKYTYDGIAWEDGYVQMVNNAAVTQICRTAGAPKDKGAGMIIWQKMGSQVKKGDKLYTIYAESSFKLERAKALAQKLNPVPIGGMLLRKIPDYSYFGTA